MEEAAMKIRLLTATILALTSMPGISLAQVPPDIADGIRKIGQVVDTPKTAVLYAPLFKDQREPYPEVTVERDVAYGPDPLNRMDIFSPGAAMAANRTVLMYVHGGGFERGDKRQNGSPFYDNIMLWAVQQGMLGINFNYRLAPAHGWPAAHEDIATAVRWVKTNAARYGGDANRLVLWGQSAGASLIAGYLAHPQFHAPGGHGVKGAVLNSGFYDTRAEGSAYFGHDPQELRERSSVEGMKKLTIPILMTHTEVDLPDAIKQADAANKALCDAGRCPNYVVFKDHSHISQGYSVGTADHSVSGPVLQYIHDLK
jgi:acetyl esterase/lipase